MQDPRQCRFSSWLQTQTSTGYGRRPGIPEVEVLHKRVHSLATEVLTQLAEERTAAALIGLSELGILRDSLLVKLNELVRSS